MRRQLKDKADEIGSMQTMYNSSRSYAQELEMKLQEMQEKLDEDQSTIDAVRIEQADEMQRQLDELMKLREDKTALLKRLNQKQGNETQFNRVKDDLREQTLRVQQYSNEITELNQKLKQNQQILEQ